MQKSSSWSLSFPCRENDPIDTCACTCAYKLTHVRVRAHINWHVRVRAHINYRCNCMIRSYLLLNTWCPTLDVNCTVFALDMTWKSAALRQVTFPSCQCGKISPSNLTVGSWEKSSVIFLVREVRTRGHRKHFGIDHAIDNYYNSKPLSHRQKLKDDYCFMKIIVSRRHI